LKAKKVFIVVKVPRDNPERQRAAALLAKETRKAGHQPFVAYQEIARRGLVEPHEFMPFVCQEVRASDLLVVLYDPELHGGLIEMGIAYAWGIPIWLLHKAGERVSSSALGCADMELAYSDLDNLEEELAANYAA
jgi:nucleoside 2-deoxyribosyltransferase